VQELPRLHEKVKSSMFFCWASPASACATVLFNFLWCLICSCSDGQLNTWVVLVCWTPVHLVPMNLALNSVSMATVEPWILPGCCSVEPLLWTIIYMVLFVCLFGSFNLLLCFVVLSARCHLVLNL
jgi:hypothetical protein